MTSARVNDTEAADALVQGDEGALYAGKACESKARRRRRRVHRRAEAMRLDP